MKFTIFNGSPSGVNGATGKMIEAFLEGARSAGADTEHISLIDYNIAYCKGCFGCWFGTPGKCVIHDDMNVMLEKYKSSDVVGFGSPVFTWDITGILKNFVDRLVPLKAPTMTVKNGHMDMEDAEEKTQKFITFSNCGFPGSDNFRIVKQVFAASEPVLEVYRNCGKLLVSKNPAAAEIVAPYLEDLRQAGAEMAKNGFVCEETKAKLDRELMSVPEYAKFLGM